MQHNEERRVNWFSVIPGVLQYRHSKSISHNESSTWCNTDRRQDTTIAFWGTNHSLNLLGFESTFPNQRKGRETHHWQGTTGGFGC